MGILREISELMKSTDDHEVNSEERKQHVMKIFDKTLEFGNGNADKKYKIFFETGLDRAKIFTEADSRFEKYVSEFENLIKKHEKMRRVKRELSRLHWTMY